MITIVPYCSTNWLVSTACFLQAWFFNWHHSSTKHSTIDDFLHHIHISSTHHSHQYGYRCVPLPLPPSSLSISLVCVKMNNDTIPITTCTAAGTCALVRKAFQLTQYTYTLCFTWVCMHQCCFLRCTILKCQPKIIIGRSNNGIICIWVHKPCQAMYHKLWVAHGLLSVCRVNLTCYKAMDSVCVCVCVCARVCMHSVIAIVGKIILLPGSFLSTPCMHWNSHFSIQRNLIHTTEPQPEVSNIIYWNNLGDDKLLVSLNNIQDMSSKLVYRHTNQINFFMMLNKWCLAWRNNTESDSY